MTYPKRITYRNPRTGQLIEVYSESHGYPTPVEIPPLQAPPEVQYPPQTSYPPTYDPTYPPMMQPMHPPAMPQQMNPYPQYTARGRESGARVAGLIVFGYLGFWVAALVDPSITILGWSGLSGFLLYRAVKSFN